ncbi:MAG: heavy-metal-associated domain-containing protein [Ginsengibacter sp.]
MKNILFILLAFLTLNATAQVKTVSLQASGLTCSMCSNAIFKALKSVDFVENVDANIKNSTFEITFKPNSKVDFDLLKDKVEKAGFFVASFWATVHFDDVNVKSDAPVVAAGNTMMFLKVKDQKLNGDKKIKIVDKGFVSSKEFKQNSSLTTKDCYKTGLADETCIAKGIEKGTRIYHVTI